MPPPEPPARVAGACVWTPPEGPWRLRDAEPVPYPNDPFAAHALEGVLRGARDLSSLSPELHAQGQDWPASYYLNIARTNLLRPFDWPADAAALEVGAGCGTITRLLGERFGEVLAVEGEPHRARMAALRTRDQPHVQVLNAPFDALELSEGFDVVFCIGVLEYAPAFAGSLAAFAERLAAAVAPAGRLVLAIENKLGLKYLAGAAEDHTGLPYDGVEGYRRSRGLAATTLSRHELAALLARVGFEHVELYLPFPDYKFPASVIAPRLAGRPSPALAGLVGHHPAPSRPHVGSYPAFAATLAWREVVAAGLVDDLANSFLFVASRSAPETPLARWGAVAFSSDARRAGYLTVSTVQDGEVVRRPLLGGAPPRPGAIRLAEMPQRAAWHERPTVGMAITAAAQAVDCTPDDLAAAARPWMEFLRSAADPRGRLPGDLLDATPGNLIVDEATGAADFFDRELVAATPLRLEVVLVRGLHVAFLTSVREPGGLGPLRRRTMWGLIRATLAAWGVRAGLRDALAFARLEELVQSTTAHRGTSLRRRLTALLLAPVGTSGPRAWLPLVAAGARRRAAALLSLR